MNAESIWLDLEQTIIASFGNPELCNVQKIGAFLQANNVSEVGIFSFAIWNEADQHEFEKHIKPTIELALDVHVVTWPTVQNMMKADFEYTGVRFDTAWEVSEFIQLRGKMGAFEHFIRSRRPNFIRAVLIDDVVTDTTITNRKTGQTIEFWNVDNL